MSNSVSPELGADNPKSFESIALSQAKTLNEQAETIRELIRKCDDNLTKAEAAYDMAEQYARQLGVDVARHDTLKYVEQYWDMVGKRDKHATALDDFHWCVFQIVNDLEEGIRNGQVAATDSVDLARRLADRFKSVNPYGSRRKNPAKLWPRPKVVLPDDPN